MAENPISLCVLLWALPGRDAALAAYEDRVLTLVAEHGGRVVRRGSVTGGGEGSPAEVQFIEFPSEAALDAYLTDPRRLAMATERDAAVARTDVHRIEPRLPAEARLPL
jgi:uncharacterized protein (DUF1330 family)